MKNILLILIVALGVGCGESHRSMNNRFSDSVIKYWSLEKCSWECNKKDSMDYYSKRGSLYNDSLKYLWNVDFPNEKQKSRNIPPSICPCEVIVMGVNGDTIGIGLDSSRFKYQNNKWQLPDTVTWYGHEGTTSSTSNDSLVYTMEFGDSSPVRGTYNVHLGSGVWPKNNKRHWMKSVQVKNDTLIRIGDNGMEYYDGKEWKTIHYDSIQMSTSEYNKFLERWWKQSKTKLVWQVGDTNTLYMDGRGDTGKWFMRDKEMYRYKDDTILRDYGDSADFWYLQDDMTWKKTRLRKIPIGTTRIDTVGGLIMYHR